MTATDPAPDWRRRWRHISTGAETTPAAVERKALRRTSIQNMTIHDMGARGLPTAAPDRSGATDKSHAMPGRRRQMCETVARKRDGRIVEGTLYPCGPQGMIPAHGKHDRS